MSTSSTRRIGSPGSTPPGRARQRRRKGMSLDDRPVLEANAAGIDIGAREIFVAVPRIATHTRCGVLGRSPKIWSACVNGSSRAAFERLPWSRQACTGFRCTISWKRAA